MSQGYGYRSEQRLRKENQDTFGVFEFDGFTLLVVCDGMGGHVGGAQASALAVRTMHDELTSSKAGDLPGHLARAVEAANRAIYEEARRNYKLMGMGTTVVATAVAGQTAWIAHVGDSRAYLLRNGQLKPLTRDHTMVNLFVDAELLSPEDAATHPEAHVLSRSLGVERQVDVDVSAPIALQPGDRLLLCSDGVHGVLEETALASIDWANPQRGTDVAMEAVAIAQGDDNATLVTYGLNIAGASAAPTSPPDPDAVAEAVRAAGGVDVQPVSAGPVSTSNTPFDDVAPIEELDEVEAIAERPPAPTPPRVDPRRERQVGYVKAVVALGSLAVIGAQVGIMLFKDPPRPAPVEEEVATVRAERPAELAIRDVPPERVGATTDAPAADAPTGAAPAADPSAVVAPGGPDAAAPAEAPDAAAAPPADVLPGEPTEAPMAAPLDDAPPEAALAEADPVAPPPAEPPDDDAIAALEPLPEGEATDGLAPNDPRREPRNPEPVSCPTCTLSLAPPPVEMYLEGEAMLVGAASFAPQVPAGPHRLPHTPARFNRPAPRGPEQAAAIRAAREHDCVGTTNLVASAMARSLDFATLYRTSWICFNDEHQQALRTARTGTTDELHALMRHFEGDWTPPEATEGEPEEVGAEVPLAMPFTAKATGGLEYRLGLFESDTRETGFQSIMLDLLGRPVVADQLGLDLLLEATAAASFSRLDSPSDRDEVAWARRVHVTAATMKGPIGDLIRKERPDLATVIEALLFEATGGDAGRAALLAGISPDGVPARVIEAYATAMGRPVPKPAEVPEVEGERTAHLRASRPSAARSDGGTRPSSSAGGGTSTAARTPKPTPTQTAAAEPESQDGKPLVIKVYKRKPELPPRN